MKCAKTASAILVLLAATHLSSQSGTWQPTNDNRIQYLWSIDDSVKDNWRCVVRFRWTGPEPENRSYNAKGLITFEGHPNVGAPQQTHLIYLLFTKQQKETNADQTHCGRVLTVSINSVQDHW